MKVTHIPYFDVDFKKLKIKFKSIFSNQFKNSN